MSRLWSVAAAVAISLWATPTLEVTRAESPVPPADLVVKGEIRLPGGQLVSFTILDRSVLTVLYGGHEPAYMFSPSLASRPTVAWLPLRVTKDAVEQLPLRGHATPTEPQALPLGAWLVVQAGDVDFAITSRKLEPARFEVQPQLDRDKLVPQVLLTEILATHGRTGNGTCCVPSGPWTICGAAVDLDGGPSCEAEGIFVSRSQGR